MNTLRPCLLTLVAALFAAQVHAAPSWKITVEQDGKTIFEETIRTQSRDTVAETWNDLLSYGLSPTKDAKGIPEVGKGDRISFKGKIRIRIGSTGTGGRPDPIAGQADLTDLNLQRAKFTPALWVIEPTDVARILEVRKAPEQKDPPK
jgi:hypothetical protein